MGARLTTEKFIEKATKVHGDKYDYTQVVYEASSIVVKIICKFCGPFLMRPNLHLSQKQDCPRCLVSPLRGSLDDFLIRAEAVHKGLYNYSNTEYVTAKTLIAIGCRVHGEFLQTPDKHVSGQGCPSCKTCGYKPNLPGCLYVLSSDRLVKIGITNKEPTTRLRQIARSAGLDFKLVAAFHDENGAIPSKVERMTLPSLREVYASPTEPFDGSTECFVDADIDSVLQVVLTNFAILRETYHRKTQNV